jgi:hypothetical protein
MKRFLKVYILTLVSYFIILSPFYFPENWQYIEKGTESTYDPVFYVLACISAICMCLALFIWLYRFFDNLIKSAEKHLKNK